MKPGPLRDLDELLLRRHDQVARVLGHHRALSLVPVYASMDVRNNRDKAAVVDSNAFPAGFNNLAGRSRRHAARVLAHGWRITHPDARNVILIPEAHTRNLGYLQNVHALQSILSDAGYTVRLATLDEAAPPRTDLATLDGSSITLHRAHRDGDDLVADGMTADVVVLNHDLAEGPLPLLEGLRPAVTPPSSLGWHRRRKAEHFRLCNTILGHLGKAAGFDPWLLGTEFEAVRGVDFRDRASLHDVAATVDRLLARIQAKYDEHAMESRPHVFVKADPGTYGRGITIVESGSQLLELNSKARERMDRGKGGVKTTSLLLQEGVPTDVRSSGLVAEPVVVMVAGTVVGGFQRIHPDKGDRENLNSPGARFRPMAFCTKLEEPPGPDEVLLDGPSCRIFELLGEVAALAMGYELRFADRLPGSVSAP